jgi:hypothetical protein
VKLHGTRPWHLRKFLSFDIFHLAIQAAVP